MINIETINDVFQVEKALNQKGFCVGKIQPALYHSFKPLLTNSISKSGLVDFIKNPYTYKFGENEKESEAISFGRLVDCITLTPELLSKEFEITDAKVLSSKMKDEARSRGVELVKKKDFDKAKLAAALASEQLKERAGGDEIITQVAIWARLETLGDLKLETPIILSGMLDALVLNNEKLSIIDLKTTSANINSNYELNKNITKYLYGIQAAMYNDLCTLAFNKECDFSLLFVSSTPPPQTRLVNMPDELLKHFKNIYMLALMKFSESCARDSWGSKNLPAMDYFLSEWDIKKIYDDIK